MAKNSGTCSAGSVQSTIRLSTLLGLTALLSACDGRTPVSPSPSPAGVPTPSSATYTLSGVVTEMTAIGPAPIEGAKFVDACFPFTVEFYGFSDGGQVTKRDLDIRLIHIDAPFEYDEEPPTL